MMDATKVAAVLRRAAEDAGCGLHEVVSGGGECPEGSCNGCREASAAWANEAADAIERCVMPEGVEWPRFEDSEIVRFGDKVSFGDEGGEVSSIELQDEGYFLLHVCDGAGRCSQRHFSPVERVKRPPVIAADGEPLEVGQTVYGTRDLEPVEIVSLRSKEYDGVRTVKCKDRTGFVFYAPDDLTHQRPVLDAGGVPIREGDTVYDKDTGDRFEVDGFSYDCVVCTDVDTCESDIEIVPSQLTHTKPKIDSWKRIEEDATLSPREYYARYVGHDVGLKDDEEVNGAFGNSLVRRCKALAERGER